MKIALIGASGFIGSGILKESLERGHQVTAIGSSPEKLPQHFNLQNRKGDATDADALKLLITGHDVVISAFNPGKDATGKGVQSIVEAAKQTSIRLLVVGGAGSLEIGPGKRLVDQPDFPAEWKGGALRTAAFLDLLRGEGELNWTFLSPPAMITPGERTGKYRVGGDQLLTDSKGESRISVPDYAVAMLDEVERPRHRRKRFTVAY